MLIIGKYLKTNNDYINVMKSSKRYNELVAMYHFNPISDTSLFLNIETQYLYEPTDMKIPKVKRYIYLYSTQELRDTLEMNESILLCNAKKYIYNQEQTLENWSGKEVDRVIYDSEIDGEESTIFRSRILNHKQVYMIVIDSDNNVFGYYSCGTVVQNNVNYSSENFMFSLHSNGRCETKKFASSLLSYCYVYSNDNYFFCGGFEGFKIYKIGTKSVIPDNISDTFTDLDQKLLTGNDSFIVKRVVVIQMK